MPAAEETFGKYVLVERIAEGGMAEVFRALLRAPGGFEKVVALKRILPTLCSEPEFVAMFKDEARIASTLTHTNIVQVFDFGAVAQSYYLTMELVDGADLGRLATAARAAGEPLPVEACSFVIAEAARGLAYAHGMHDATGTPLAIVHRDVSPQNVLVSRQGEIKVSDFGIAKAAGKLHRTAAGILMGKLRYMSPEQASGDATLDGRSDIFSLGVVLHEILTGLPLFAGDNPLAITDQIRSAPIDPPSRRNPRVPAVLDEVVLRALARNRDARFANAGELARELAVLTARISPAFVREDLGDLVTRLCPPTLTAPPFAATVVRRPERGRAVVWGTAADSEAVGGAPTEQHHAGAEHLGEARPVPGATDERWPRRAAASRTFRLRLAVGAGVCGALGLAGVAVHAIHRGGTAQPWAAAPRSSPEDARATTPIDATHTLTWAPHPLPAAAASPTCRSLYTGSPPAVLRRGTIDEPYLAALSALDETLATLDADGSPLPLPPAFADRLQRDQVSDAARLLISCSLATGVVPPMVLASIDSLLTGPPRTASTAVVAQGSVGPYSVAAIVLFAHVHPNARELDDAVLGSALLGRYERSFPPDYRPWYPPLVRAADAAAALRSAGGDIDLATAVDNLASTTPPGAGRSCGAPLVASLITATWLPGDAVRAALRLANPGSTTVTPAPSAFLLGGRGIHSCSGTVMMPPPAVAPGTSLDTAIEFAHCVPDVYVLQFEGCRFAVAPAVYDGQTAPSSQAVR